MRASPDLFESNEKDIQSLFDNIDSNEESEHLIEFNEHNNEVGNVVLEHNQNSTIKSLNNSGTIIYLLYLIKTNILSYVWNNQCEYKV